MKLSGLKVLVAGSAGLVGSNLVERLLLEGAAVRATVYKSPPVIGDPRIEYVTADLTSPADCSRVVDGQEIVFMCAASTSGAAVISRSPMTHVTPNVIMNTLMLEAAHAAGVQKFLWLASTTGYPPSDSPVTEDQMFEGEPFEAYYFVGWMKRFTEILCRMYGEKLPNPMTTIVLRPTNIYGPRDDFDPATSHVTAALIRKVIERHAPLEVWGTGKDVRDLIHVDDMVEAIIQAAEQVDSYGVFNIGAGQGYSVVQILENLVELDGFTDAQIKFDPSRPTTIPIRLVDVSKAERVLGFKPTVELREGLARTLQWYRLRYTC